MKNRSYAVRENLADLLGKPRHQDFTCSVFVRLRGNETATLRSTSNAGFRGIEGSFEFADGTRKTLSLGEVVDYDEFDAVDWEPRGWRSNDEEGAKQ